MLGFIDYELLMSYSPQSEYPNNAIGDCHARSHGLDMGSLQEYRYKNIDNIGGAEEDRTPDLLCARQVLSHLSYGPRSKNGHGGSGRT